MRYTANDCTWGDLERLGLFQIVSGMWNAVTTMKRPAAIFTLGLACGLSLFFGTSHPSHLNWWVPICAGGGYLVGWWRDMGERANLSERVQRLNSELTRRNRE